MEDLDTIKAGAIEKHKNQVPVFEVNAAFTDIFMGLETDNEGYDMTKFMAVGSMEEPKTNGNWKD